jgi:hypothetical protein
VPDPADVRVRVARSVGMIVSVEVGEAGILEVSTCSVTLVDADKVITAGHCHQPSEALNSSVTFDYQTAADGSRPPGYNPRFYKVKAVLGHRNTGSSLDYSLLQLAEAPAGIPAIQMRHDLPSLHEAVFGVHHPNGAVKKLSIPHGAGFSQVTGNGADGINVPGNFHVSGGSSGSGLFDTAGRIVGVLSRGAPCSGGALAYCPTPNILADLVPAPRPSVSRDVVVVLDRSGSMSTGDGTGRTKIAAARDAISLFVQLIRASAGNRVGLVSFSTSATANFAIANLTSAARTALVGPAPYAGGIVGALTPGGATSIGGGIDAARSQFPMPTANPRTILLMTDGLQNTPPSPESAAAALTGISLHAIGFGTESSLNGALLTSLTAAHSGMYMRAGGGLALEKFFSSAFGNIFETGVVFDPETDLAANADGDPIRFGVCGEEAITAVAGWEGEHASLLLELTTPAGNVIRQGVKGAKTASGRTWTFLRVPLPFGGEGDGAWSVRVVRPRGGGEFPPPTPPLRYFVNVIPSGGPRMSRTPDARRYYTGDRVNPSVMIRHDDGGWPDAIKVALTVTGPDTGVGNVLAGSGLNSPGSVDADAIPARQATLMAIEAATGQPVAHYVDTDFDLSDSSEDTEGLFERSGTFGRSIDGLLRVEGNYTFHARATYGRTCEGNRELVWSLHVEVGIDGGQTTVTTTPLGNGPAGTPCARMTITPRDRYGNLLGPGRLDAFTIAPGPGTSLSGEAVDAGGGAYHVDVCSDAGTLEPPTVTITQPGRPPVVVGSSDFRRYVYSVKYLCGTQAPDNCGCEPVAPGRYATEINVHNPTGGEVPVLIRPIPLVLGGAAVGREPKYGSAGEPTVTRLPAHSATMIDCCRITELVLGAAPSGSASLNLGILEIVSTVDLQVTAVHTTGDGTGGPPSIEVHRIRPQAYGGESAGGTKEGRR